MTKPRRRQAGEGSISAYKTKAGDSRYLIKWATEDRATGERRVHLKRVTRTGQPMTTRQAAADELREVLVAAKQGTWTEPSKTTVGDWLDQWLKGLQLAPSTRSSYDKNVRLHIKPHLGGIQLQRLTGSRISTLYRTLEQGGRQDHKAGNGLSPRTVRYVHTILKAALTDAVREGLIATNPAATAKPPSARAAKAPEIHPWTADQLRTFLDWCRATSARHATAYHVLAATGMRRGELLALRWRDLDFDEARLSVRRSVGVVKTKGAPESLVEGPTKSARARVIDVDGDTLSLLRTWRKDRGGIALQLARDDALIFGDLNGGHLHPERFSRGFVDKVAQCRRKVDDAPPAIHLHDLRHTHATLLLRAGEPVKVVQERLGHATSTITLDIYSHVMPGMQARAAATFANLLQGGAS